MPSLDHCLLYCLLRVSRSDIDVGGLQLMLRMLVFPNLDGFFFFFSNRSVFGSPKTVDKTEPDH